VSHILRETSGSVSPQTAARITASWQITRTDVSLTVHRR